MTMMALTRKRHRAYHLWALALGLLFVGALSVGLQGSPASAIAEGDVQFTVSQSPDGGSFVQVGATASFVVTPTVTNAPFNIPLYIEFLTPSGLVYTGSNAPGGITCALIPATDDVRCDYGNVVAGPIVPVTLNFTVSNSVTTSASQFRARAGAADGGPDLASDGDDSFANAGSLTVFSSSTVAAGGSPDLPTVFEGKSFTYTATFQNNSGVATGTLTNGAAILFTNATVTNIVCSHGSAGGLGGANAACNTPNIPDTETLTITATAIAANTATGADVTVQLSAPQLGISQAGSGVTVDELGLDFIGATLAAGTPINICTGLVPGDVANDAAAGQAQTGTNAVVGSPSQNPLLAVGDFLIAGPAAVTTSAASGCGANQSGVNFTPSIAGTYTVTANYNVGGTNVLSLTVGGGPANNPVPTASLLSPSSASAGSSAFTLTVTGTGFVSGSSVVRWGGVALVTTFISSTTLEASVPAANVLSAGTASITVFTSTPGGGTSNALTFTTNAAPNPVPTISGLTPSSAGSGAAQFSMSVTGANFVAGSVVRWSGIDLVTTYDSATSLTATVPAANVATAGAANVTVFNPGPGGGASVTPQVFTITPGATKLAFTTQPGAGVAGSALAAQPAVAVQTAANATVTSDSTTLVTLVMNGTGTLTCTGGLSKTAAAGVATFAGCAVNTAGTGYTITASATSLTSATSATFDVSAAPPTTSTQLTVTNPTNLPIPRSRLSFESSTGSLTATAVSFIVKRKADGKYWNASTAIWQAELVLNTAVHGSGATWSLAITGDHRRAFAETVVTLELRATVGATVYVNATIPDLSIR